MMELNHLKNLSINKRMDFLQNSINNLKFSNQEKKSDELYKLWSLEPKIEFILDYDSAILLYGNKKTIPLYPLFALKNVKKNINDFFKLIEFFDTKKVDYEKEKLFIINSDLIDWALVNENEEVIKNFLTKSKMKMDYINEHFLKVEKTNVVGFILKYMKSLNWTNKNLQNFCFTLLNKDCIIPDQYYQMYSGEYINNPLFGKTDIKIFMLLDVIKKNPEVFLKQDLLFVGHLLNQKTKLYFNKHDLKKRIINEYLISLPKQIISEKILKSLIKMFDHDIEKLPAYQNYLLKISYENTKIYSKQTL